MNKTDYYLAPKRCKCCDAIISFERRHLTFCNSSCAATYNNKGTHRGPTKKRKQKPCIYCGSLSADQNLKYCSNACQGIHKRNMLIEKWMSNGYKKKKIIPPHIRIHLMSIKSNKCELCGWGEVNTHTGNYPLTIHHIDGDCLNNVLNNLQVLCPNCHSLTHNYGALNRGKSKRTNRRRVNEQQEKE